MQNGAQNSSSQNYQSNDTALLTQVPSDLKTLIRIIMRNFYSFELYLCMEMLLIYPCMKEDDLAEVLRLDLKVVHQYLVNLKKEKFLNEKCIMETSPDGKQTKFSYFFINYKMIVNVIKYKLDQIRVRIESEEKQITTRSLFKCTLCAKTYSDLDTKDIFLTMRCTHCGGDIDEDTSAIPKQSARNLLHKFNTQMKIVFELLSKVEHVRLAEFLLRPEASDMTDILEKINPGLTTAKTNSNSGRSAMVKYDKWSGDKTRNTDLLGQTRITINFDSNSNSNQAQKKELPSILLLNRIPEEEPMNRDSQLLNSLKSAADQTINRESLNDTTNLNLPQQQQQQQGLVKPLSNNNQQQQQIVPLGNLENIIMQKLLKHEKKISDSSSSSSSQNASNTNGSSSSSITITKRRSILDESKNDFKKRKLNNGESDDRPLRNGFYNSGSMRRNHSDGSENSDEYDDDYEENEDLSFTSSSSDPNEDLLIPRILVKNKPIRFDRITPKLINHMTELEKENYIQICRQLYTEIYEI
ncbi:unnamed protein product [Brachionus calyciflorus]|uniref:HTH TFE/IIEalpha-type domain-containing protein n=1 Tax=Brachionus calyciflorus TaxID=104777 RepID=A0A813PPU5_9BILA|nr:unnamed protein product [Brachionus calyciflorus]